MKYYVEIVKYDSGEVVRRVEARSEHAADRIDRGANINLNHEHYYTRIVTKPKGERIAAPHE